MGYHKKLHAAVAKLADAADLNQTRKCWGSPSGQLGWILGQVSLVTAVLMLFLSAETCPEPNHFDTAIRDRWAQVPRSAHTGERAVYCCKLLKR